MAVPLSIGVKVDYVNCAHLPPESFTKYMLHLGDNKDGSIKCLCVCMICWGNLLSKGYESFAQNMGKSMGKQAVESAFHHD